MQNLIWSHVRRLLSVGQTDPLEYIKNPMVAEFMGFHRDTSYSESELEQALIFDSRIIYLKDEKTTLH